MHVHTHIKGKRAKACSRGNTLQQRESCSSSTASGVPGRKQGGPASGHKARETQTENTQGEPSPVHSLLPCRLSQGQESLQEHMGYSDGPRALGWKLGQEGDLIRRCSSEELEVVARVARILRDQAERRWDSVSHRKWQHLSEGTWPGAHATRTAELTRDRGEKI